MYVYQNSGAAVFILNDEGRMAIIPNDEPLEIKEQVVTDVDSGGMPKQSITPAAKVAQELCDRGRLYGVVLVPQVRDGMSINFDVKGSAIKSGEVRKAAEDELIAAYVTTQKQEGGMNRPVRAPSTAIQGIMDRRGIDLERDLNIHPVGWKAGEGVTARDAEIEALKKSNADMAAKLDMLLVALGESAAAKKQKAG